MTDWKALLIEVLEAWSASYDCSADPGHSKMEAAASKAWDALDEDAASTPSETTANYQPTTNSSQTGSSAPDEGDT